MFAEFYGGGAALQSAVSDLEEAAKQLGLSDVDEHIGRIRRGLIEDAPLAIGSAKELLETVFKTILGGSVGEDGLSDRGCVTV
ncbi:hypothetical protein [Nocardia fluminea]|uniref:hypothetical protein n=1 Tax=Nocardia fluminea TaxID=134984 RepID=UPI0037B3BF10